MNTIENNTWQYQPEGRRPEGLYLSRVDMGCDTDFAMYCLFIIYLNFK